MYASCIHASQEQDPPPRLQDIDPIPLVLFVCSSCTYAYHYYIKRYYRPLPISQLSLLTLVVYRYVSPYLPLALSALFLHYDVFYRLVTIILVGKVIWRIVAVVDVPFPIQ